MYVVSLGAGITMLMTEDDDPSRSGGRNILDSRLAGYGIKEPTKTVTSNGKN